MGRLLRRLRKRFNNDSDDDEDDPVIHDEDAEGLSYVGQAAYEVLKDKHSEHHLRLWNVTSGNMEALDQTPKDVFDQEDYEEGHSDWFPEKLGKMIAQTKVWCDVMSLTPPDGKFLECIRDAITEIHRNADEDGAPPIVRFLFGNIVGMPTNCTAVLDAITRDLPPDPNVLIWVGSWRNGVSWNHAKIIAVDGALLHTGGHNLWDRHYLRHSPVFDLSVEFTGKVAHDGHLFANNAWRYIKSVQGKFIGRITENLPDFLPTVLKRRVIVTEFPGDEAGEFPPMYKMDRVPENDLESPTKIMTIGRTGGGAHPADDAFVAMIESAQTVIRLALQDLGPVCFPGTDRPLPGCIWPHNFLNAFAKVIWEKGVDVEIILSNPSSIPGGLSGTEACYGNGWTCVDVASEIIKSVKNLYPDAGDDDLREKVSSNLRICMLKTAETAGYSDGNTKGLHSKHFIVDDVATYIGSQNLYVCDLSEWGVVVDDPEQTERIKTEYWDPMWEQSHTGGDVDVDAVMDGLGIDRDGKDPVEISLEEKIAAALAMTQHQKVEECEFLDDHDPED